MNITCSICSDLFVPSSEIYVTNCGHTFHQTCLKKWLERSKTCPQCRTKTYEKNIHRVFFNIVTLDGSKEDVVALQNKLDALKLQLHLNENQMKSDEEKIQSITKQNSDLEAKYKQIRHELDKTKTGLISVKEKLDYYKDKTKYTDKLESEIKSIKDELRRKSQTVKAITGTVEEANEIINSSACSTTLASIACSLKKELQQVEKKKNNYFTLMKRAEHQLHSCKKELEAICVERDKLKIDLTTHKHCEQEMQTLKTKISELMEHSKVLDPALIRVATESPAPAPSKVRSAFSISPTVDERVKEIKDSNSPYLKVKSNAMGLLFKTQETGNKFTTSNKMSIFKTLSSSSVDDVTTVKKPLPEYNYDGFGGHSKDEKFPIPRPTQGIKRTKSSMSSNKFRKLSKPNNKKIDELLDLSSLD